MSLEHTQTQTLVSALVERANRDPNAVAITFIERGEHRQITTGELLQETSRAAANLAAGGIGAGDLVILVLQHSLELIYSFCGAALLGAIPSIFPFLGSLPRTGQAFSRAFGGKGSGHLFREF